MKVAIRLELLYVIIARRSQVYFPALPGQRGKGAKSLDRRFVPMARSKPLNPATVLIVENEALVRLEIAHVVAQAGLRALEANDADEAIALLDAHPDIVLMVTDINMPGSMDGLRLAHHVRDRWPPVKIIVASGRLETELSELPANCVFIPKPYAQETLWRALAQMLMVNREGHTSHSAA
jgi:CheY-like chemotaxis protein